MKEGVNKEKSYELFNQVAGTYDQLNRMLSFGIDKYWRAQILNALPPQKGLKILDLATGTADVPLSLRRDPRVSLIRGIDPSKEMLTVGLKKVQTYPNISLDLGDAHALREEDCSYDVVTMAFGIRNCHKPEQVFKEIYRVLKEEGKFIVLEFSLPKLKFLRAPYLFYFRKILPTLGNYISGHQNAYTYLNESVENFPEGEAFLRWPWQARFKDCEEKRFTGGIVTLYTGLKKDART